MMPSQPFFSSCRHRLFFLVCMLGVIGGSLVAQVPTDLPENEPALSTDPYDLSNPRASVSRHLHYLQPDSYRPDLAKDALWGEEQEFDREALALKLIQIFNYENKYIDTSLLASSSMYTDSVSGRHRQYIDAETLPWVYVEKYGDRWLYAAETVNRIDEEHRKRIPGISSLFIKLFPNIGQKRMLGIEVWQYAGMLIFLLLSWGLYLLLRSLFALLIQRIIPQYFPDLPLNLSLIRLLATPLSLYLVTWLIREVFVPALVLPIGVNRPIILVLEVVGPVLGVIVMLRLIDVVADLFTRFAEQTSSTMDNQVVPLIRRMAKLLVVVFGAIFILSNLDVDITALLAGVSIGGLALALAAQDTVKNFIGSLAIFVDRPFVMGDFIETSSFSGVITEVGVRTTRVRASDGAQVTVPNGKLADMIITNHGVRTYRRYATNLALTYDSPPDKIERFVEGVREIAQAHPLSDPESVTVQFHEMADSSLNVFFAVIYQTPAYGEWLKARQEVFLDVMKLAEELELSFAFPSTSVYLENNPSIPDSSTE